MVVMVDDGDDFERAAGVFRAVLGRAPLAGRMVLSKVPLSAGLKVILSAE